MAIHIRPEAVAYKFYGWLRALCGWLAGSRLNYKQAMAAAATAD